MPRIRNGFACAVPPYRKELAACVVQISSAILDADAAFEGRRITVADLKVYSYGSTPSILVLA